MKISIHNLAFILLLFALTSCNSTSNGGGSALQHDNMANAVADLPDLQPDAPTATAVFASGCFWCTEAVFERVKGVQNVISGYAGGTTANPTYKAVSEGNTDYAEAVIVYYDSTVVSYPTLLNIFFHSHDPTQLNRQGPDIGAQYRSGIYYSSPYQHNLAVEYKEKLQKVNEFSKPIVTEIEPLTKFWPAEQYHQDYYALNPDNPYIRTVSRPKVVKFEKEYQQYLKDEYRAGISK